MQQKNNAGRFKLGKAVLAAGLTASLVFGTAGYASAQGGVKVDGSQLDVVSVDKSLYIPYDTGKYGSALSAFPDGFKPGYGSSLTYKDTLPDGSIEYYGLGDRGPNVDAPNVIFNGVTYNGKFFVTPDYSPSIAVVKVSADGKTASVEDGSVIKLKNKSGQLLNGKVYQTAQGLSTNNTSNPKKPFLQFTPSLSSIADTGEMALDANIQPITPSNPNPNDLNTDITSLDTEGLAVDKDGNFWVSDEYGPFVVEFDKNGNELKRLQPGSGLPGVLVNRIPNRGLEDLSISPSGKIFTVEQSVLDIGGTNMTSAKGYDSGYSTGRCGTATFVRVMEIDPDTGSTIATYGYPLVASDGSTIQYANKKDMKLGDIVALSDTKLLVIEQGSDVNGTFHNVVYQLDLSNATNLDDYMSKTYGDSLSGDDTANALENSATLPAGVQLGSKSLLLDLRQYGWPTNIEKAEGIALSPDGKTLTIVNDNDFSASYTVGNPDNGDDDITNYTVAFDASGSKTWYHSKTLTAADIAANDSAASGSKINDPKLTFNPAPDSSATEEDNQNYLLNIKLDSSLWPAASYQLTAPAAFVKSGSNYVATVTINRGAAQKLADPKLYVVYTIQNGTKQFQTYQCLDVSATDTATKDIVVSAGFSKVMTFLVDGNVDWSTGLPNMKSNALTITIPS